MYLGEFLNTFEFDYTIVNGQIRLIDLQGVYLGDIGRDRFLLTREGISMLVDRMNTYINDYVISDLEGYLRRYGYDVDSMDLADMAKILEEKEIPYDKEIVNAILNPGSIDVEKEKIVESFSYGQVFYEMDTGRVIELDSVDEKGDWSFGVYDTNNTPLYDSSSPAFELAECIRSGYMRSITHETKLRIDPEFNILEAYYDPKTLTAVVEETDFLLERFAGAIEMVEGELYQTRFLYDSEADIGQFELKFADFSCDDEKRYYHNIEVPATDEEKENMVKEMQAISPELFDKITKKSLDSVIKSASESIREDHVKVSRENCR